MTDFDFIRRLEEVAQQPNGGPEAASALESWINDGQPFVDVREVVQFAAVAPLDLIVDSFRCTMPFGTGGRRGRVGIGPNRLNKRLLALTVAGHAEYLRKMSSRSKLLVVIANDTRRFTDITATHHFMGSDWSLRGITSRDLAVLASKIYAAYGIDTYMTSPDDPDGYMPTPELSFAIREMRADGGLNVSASHNHPDDNGLKVFTPQGGQYCPPDDEDLARTVELVQLPTDIEAKIAALGDVALAIPQSVHKNYIDMYLDEDRAICRSSSSVRSGVSLVFTPLCGTGLASVGEVLQGAGYTFAVPTDQYPDGSFSSIPMRSPNPEIAGVTEPAMAYANSVGADLVLSTDPDADRLGVDFRFPNGNWKHLTGNQIATILAYFLVADETGPMLSGSIVTTVATSRSLAAIGALGSGVDTISDLMIGFKFIGQHLDSVNDLEPSDSSRLILAAEESHGYLTTASLRDKDAASAAFIMAHLHAEMRWAGLTLWDYLMRIYERIGVYIEQGRYLVLPGAQGAETIAALMESLRTSPIMALGGEQGISHRDYRMSSATKPMTEGEKASRNVLELITEHYRLVVRPSGTEAKLKYYFDYHEDPTTTGSASESYDTTEDKAKRACSEIYGDLAKRAGYELSKEALELPDVMTLAAKAQYGKGTAEK